MKRTALKKFISKAKKDLCVVLETKSVELIALNESVHQGFSTALWSWPKH